MIDREAWIRASARTVVLTGNEPIVLDGDSTVRLIESGSVAVSCVEVRNGAPAGPRRMLRRVGSGQAIFSVPISRGDGLRFMIVPIKEAVILEAPAAVIWNGEGGLRKSLAHLLDEWIDHLAGVLSGYSEPKLPLRIQGEQAVSLEEGQALCPERNAVVWTRVEGGTARCMGSGELVLDVRPGMFPLGAGMWLQAGGSVNVATRETGSIEDWDTVEQGLGRLHSIVLAHLRALDEKESEGELVRLLERDLIHADRTEEAIAELASVLEPREPRVAGDSPLMRAMSAIGRSLGIGIRPPGKSEESGNGADALEAIARASRIRTRRVKLSRNWWKRDCGSLLGFTAGEERRPVALLRSRSLRYQIFDPIEGTRTPVDKRTAGLLSSEAVVLYRPLPEGKLRLRELFRFSLQGRERDFVLVIVTGVITTLLGMITPQATALLMDHAIPEANSRLLLEIGAGLLAAAFGRLAFQMSQGIVLMRIGISSEAESQAALWDRLLRLRPSFFRRFSSGDLQSRVMAVNEVGRQLSGATLTTLFSSFMALMNLALLYYYNPKLSLLAVSVGFVVMVFTVSISAFVRKNLRELMERDGTFFGLVVQLINGVGKLRVAGAISRAYTHWVKEYSVILKLLSKIFRLRELVYVFNHVLPILSSAILFYFAFDMLMRTRSSGLADGLTLGTFLAFNVAFSTFLGGITSLSSTIVGFMDVFAIGRRIKPILEEDPEIDESKTDPGHLTGRISMNSVVFRYREDGAMVLDGVSLQAEPGEFIALVGPSGSGKSTILRMFLGFESPASGAVSYDGQDLANLDVLAVRRQLGVVLQGGRLDSGSIFDNIASGNVITLDEAWAAAEDAGFADEVREMPMGMHTIVSVGGGNLSGGQRQRLLIARALAHRPRILLFDEATSALDNRTQAIVSESLGRLNVTRIVIAHRLSTIRAADRIYVLEGGRIVQGGSFNELMAERDGLFARMMVRQVA